MADSGLRPAVLLGLAALTIGVAVVFFDVGGLPSLVREEAFDVVGRFLPAPRKPDGVIVVDIDRASLAAKGAWPWRRGMLADLLTKTTAGDPSVIGLDMLLAGPDRRAPGPALEALAKDTGRADIAALAKTLPDDDQALADAISKGNVVLGLVLDATSHDAAPAGAPVAASGAVTPPSLPDSPGIAAPLPALADGAAAVGVLSLSAGPGDRVRAVPAFVRAAGEIYAGFAMEALRNGEGASTFVLGHGGRSVDVGEATLPLADGATLRVHPAKPADWSARTVSAADVLDGKVPASRFSDRIVLVGSSAPEAGALLATAADPLTPTVQFQADAIEDFRVGRILHRPDHAKAIETATGIGLGLLALLAALALGPLVAAAVLVALIAAIVGASVLAFARADLLLDPVGPLVPAIFGANTAALMLFARTRRLRSAIEAKFSRYLSPEIVRRLAANPGELRIEGELREVTALFSDIESFTTMTETAEPRLLVAALDAYFEGTCAIVIQHGGMVDKIVGDSVHALFNAPLALAGHARAALDCAVEIGAFARAFREREDAKQLGFGRTRVGFETGPVIVGDVGGLGHLDYTAHGDAVNSAARLESVNKEFGTTICVGARAAAAIDDPSRLRRLGTVLLRGRSAPSAIYEPWPADATAERRQAYAIAAAAREDGRDDAGALFAALAVVWPDDPATLYWKERLAAGSNPGSHDSGGGDA